MVYPPPGPLAHAALRAYKGEKLIYVGEGVNGVNADANFFCDLCDEWMLREAIELPTLPDSYEKAFFLERLQVPRQDHVSMNPPIAPTGEGCGIGTQALKSDRSDGDVGTERHDGKNNGCPEKK